MRAVVTRARLPGSFAACFSACAVAFGMAGCGGATHSATVPVTTVAPVAAVTSPAVAVKATNTLAVALLRRLGGSGNAIFSPYSVQTALAMVDQGAAGSTAQALDRLLGAATSPITLAASEHALAADLHAGLSAKGAPALNNADAIWVRKGLALESGFAGANREYFGVAPQTADFAADPDGARQAINAWVATQTNQLIPNLFGPGSITNQTALVLANAIYLQAKWSVPFDPSLTQPATFTSAPGQTEQTPFMSISSDLPTQLPYAHGSGWIAVGLPYAHSGLQMLAVMPTLGKLAAFQSRLTTRSLGQVTGALKSAPVLLTMPKLSLTLNANLNGPLTSLGIGVAFGSQANFSKIAHGAGLQITDVQHDAVLNVDEKGTVAAAATGVVVAPTAVPVETDTVHVDLDHPFLLFLRDTHTGAILFAGRVSQPAAG